ncbi:uncharacterized protein LOC111337897 isoform X2 [Stylophora pistillata]|uniref:Ubiquitin-like domain-containing protein n=1 Tax=Stylophora pistillata TaxID=50429 RepID=A0A2B4RTV1_STYPI|nr:uncharacterized protein LOC111337897 isoform X2 [Stylophora pistillata]PFX19675.1 hypothetical protein AWC38_SpisGene15912 [Stylophora pistillata]
MDFYVDYSCENNTETGRFKLTVPDLSTTSIRDVKIAIQEAIQAPVCDQKLFYQGQLLSDDQMTLGRLYFKEGESLKLQFLAVVDITGMRKLLSAIKTSAKGIVEKLHRQLPDILMTKDPNGSAVSFSFSQAFGDVKLGDTYRALPELSSQYFAPWKCLKSRANRHFFVQEGGFDAFLEVFKYSLNLFLFADSQETSDDQSPMDIVMLQTMNHLKRHFDQGQLLLEYRCLSCLWTFTETYEDKKFALSKGVFPLSVEALLIHPDAFKEAGFTDLARLIVLLNQSAVGCCAGFVEYDSKLQEQAAKSPAMISKLLFMIDRSQSEPAEYSLFSSQVASNTLFYCTFNVKSAQYLVNLGVVEKMLNITKRLLDDEEGNFPLRYYCCLFLARMRSAPLVILPTSICSTIDELIDTFLDRHVPCEVTKYEGELSFVWMTIVPLVHLAFAGGKEYTQGGKVNHSYHGDGHQGNSSNLDSTQSKENRFYEGQSSSSAINDLGVALSAVEINADYKNHLEPNKDERDSKCELRQGKKACAQLEAEVTEEAKVTIIGTTVYFQKINQVNISSQKVECHCATAKTQSLSTEKKDCVMEREKDQFIWPGSKSTQKLGIFSLVHMFSIKENRELALSENLPVYLVCLSWHLPCELKEKLKLSMDNLYFASSPPSLKVAAKSVLALMRGFDMFYRL